MDKVQVRKLIRELEDLWHSADMNSRRIIENGQEYTDADRAKSEGYASAYSFCILRLKDLLD